MSYPLKKMSIEWQPPEELPIEKLSVDKLPVEELPTEVLHQSETLAVDLFA